MGLDIVEQDFIEAYPADLKGFLHLLLVVARINTSLLQFSFQQLTDWGVLNLLFDGVKKAGTFRLLEITAFFASQILLIDEVVEE
jgi:hypothetical protein